MTLPDTLHDMMAQFTFFLSRVGRCYYSPGPVAYLRDRKMRRLKRIGDAVPSAVIVMATTSGVENRRRRVEERVEEIGFLALILFEEFVRLDFWGSAFLLPQQTAERRQQCYSVGAQRDGMSW